MPSPPPFDIIITGAGPAGSACALAAATAGMRVAIVERAVFPRHKVCGDCLNPGVWPVLESLGVADEIRALPHATPEMVRFLSLRGREVRIPLPQGAERVVTRESMDAALLAAAQRAGAEVFENSPVTRIRLQARGFREIEAGNHVLTARLLVAADGRNSTTCRLLGITPPARAVPSVPARVAIQCHLPCPPERARTVSLEWTPYGYCGLAPLAGGLLNLCVLCQGKDFASAKMDASRRYGCGADTEWSSIAPMDRPALPPAPLPGVLLAGDAARVLEPFTGEGIFYALSSGQLAAEAARRELSGEYGAVFYRNAHARLFRRRLWINQLAKHTVTHRGTAEILLTFSRRHPALLKWLTGKITGDSG